MTLTILELAKQWSCDKVLIEGLQSNAFIRVHVDKIFIRSAILTMPVLKSNGLKTTAGKAIYRHPRIGPHIKLHSALFDDNDPVANDRYDTFFHEIAHHISYMAANERGHQNAWAYSMQHFGYTPSRCYEAAKFNYKGYKNRAETREVDAIVNDFLGDF